MGDSEPARAKPSSRRRRKRHPAWAKAMARWMFHGHLWLGVAVTALVLLICATGILLNHKRTFGLMPDVEHVATAPFEAALPLAELVARAGVAAGDSVAAAGVDRMDVRPGDGLVKVRFDDDVVTEVTLDLATGDVLEIGERNDVFLEKLHSGEIFGEHGILLSDVVAIVLTLLVLSGFWMWLYPRSRR